MFQGQRDKYMTLGMISVLFLTSTLDMMFDWINLSHLQSLEYRHSLVVGPPSHSACTALLMFNIIGVLFYLFECFNAFTILTNNRSMRLPVVWEQGITLILLEIPQAAINLSVVTCRLHHVASSQVVSGIFSIMKVGIRLYLYGWFREKEYGIKETSTFKTTLKIALYVTVSVIWLSLIVTEFFMWQGPWYDFDGLGDVSVGGASWIHGVSIILLHRRFWEKPENFTLDPYLDDQKLSYEEPWLVKDIGFILTDPNRETTATYVCNKNATASPVLCESHEEILFHFRYYLPSFAKPFGSIHYNYAGISASQCTAGRLIIQGEWTMAYLHILAVTHTYDDHTNTTIIGHAPWLGVCSLPTPHFDDKLAVC